MIFLFLFFFKRFSEELTRYRAQTQTLLTSRQEDVHSIVMVSSVMSARRQQPFLLYLLGIVKLNFVVSFVESDDDSTSSACDEAEKGLQQLERLLLSLEPSLYYSDGQYCRVTLPHPPQKKSLGRQQSLSSPPGLRGFSNLEKSFGPG